MTDAYEFDGGVFHPRCLISAMGSRGQLSPAARDMATGDVLKQFVEANAVKPVDAGADWLPRRVAATAHGQRACSGCDRPLNHDVSVPLRPDPMERATGQTRRPTAAEISALLRDYRQMVADAGGWASRIPRDRVSQWEARKHDLLARIALHTAGRTQTSRDDGRGIDRSREHGQEWSL